MTTKPLSTYLGLTRDCIVRICSLSEGTPPPELGLLGDFNETQARFLVIREDHEGNHTFSPRLVPWGSADLEPLQGVGTESFIAHWFTEGQTGSPWDRPTLRYDMGRLHDPRNASFLMWHANGCFEHDRPVQRILDLLRQSVQAVGLSTKGRLDATWESAFDWMERMKDRPELAARDVIMTVLNRRGALLDFARLVAAGIEPFERDDPARDVIDTALVALAWGAVETAKESSDDALYREVGIDVLRAALVVDRRKPLSAYWLRKRPLPGLEIEHGLRARAEYRHALEEASWTRVLLSVLQTSADEWQVLERHLGLTVDAVRALAIRKWMADPDPSVFSLAKPGDFSEDDLERMRTMLVDRLPTLAPVRVAEALQVEGGFWPRLDEPLKALALQHVIERLEVSASNTDLYNRLHERRSGLPWTVANLVRYRTI